jgi:hypothetical protein
MTEGERYYIPIHWLAELQPSLQMRRTVVEQHAVSKHMQPVIYRIHTNVIRQSMKLQLQHVMRHDSDGYKIDDL